jgi:cation diffusion facilitator CzcD-associated flavoprotein CzcO
MPDTLIIGAGPAGLAVAGRLSYLGIAYEMIEKSDAPAASWRAHYDRLHLHTVKKHSHLPYRPFPKEYPRFVGRDQLIAYMDDYAAHFNISPQLNTSLERITKEGNRYLVKTNKDERHYKHVVVATGVNRVPHIPPFANQNAFKSRIIHSRMYKNPTPFQHQKVLVVGMGNTGAEVALDLSNAGIDTSLSVRGPVNLVPLEFLGRATQESGMLLDKLPKKLSASLSRLVQKLTIGDLSAYGIERPAIAASHQLAETGDTPVIDLGTAKAIKEGKIKVLSGIESFTENGVQFTNGAVNNFDVVILCTGYHSKINEFIPGIDSFFDKRGNPRHCIGVGQWEGLYFPGYDLFKTGGVLGLIHEESGLIAEEIRQKKSGS